MLELLKEREVGIIEVYKRLWIQLTCEYSNTENYILLKLLSTAFDIGKRSSYILQSMGNNTTPVKPTQERISTFISDESIAGHFHRFLNPRMLAPSDWVNPVFLSTKLSSRARFPHLKLFSMQIFLGFFLASCAHPKQTMNFGNIFG